MWITLGKTIEDFDVQQPKSTISYTNRMWTTSFFLFISTSYEPIVELTF